MILARLFAKRLECVFIDNVNHREVFAYQYRGKQWLGQSRFEMWVNRMEAK